MPFFEASIVVCTSISTSDISAATVQCNVCNELLSEETHDFKHNELKSYILAEGDPVIGSGNHLGQRLTCISILLKLKASTILKYMLINTTNVLVANGQSQPGPWRYCNLMQYRSSMI